MSDRQLKLQFVLIGRSTEPGWKLRDKLPCGSAEAWTVCSASLKNSVAAFRQSYDRQVWYRECVFIDHSPVQLSGGLLFVHASPC